MYIYTHLAQTSEIVTQNANKFFMLTANHTFRHLKTYQSNGWKK